MAKKIKTTTLTFRLSDDTKIALYKVAQKEDRSAGYIVNRAINEHLQQISNGQHHFCNKCGAIWYGDSDRCYKCGKALIGQNLLLMALPG